jgi:aspartyl protease family protein
MALAQALNLDLGGDVVSSTANGLVRGKVTQADVTLQGGVRVARLHVTALPALGAPLIGMNVLGRLHWRQRDGVLSIDLGGGS